MVHGYPRKINRPTRYNAEASRRLIRNLKAIDAAGLLPEFLEAWQVELRRADNAVVPYADDAYADRLGRLTAKLLGTPAHLHIEDAKASVCGSRATLAVNLSDEFAARARATLKREELHARR